MVVRNPKTITKSKGTSLLLKEGNFDTTVVYRMIFDRRTNKNYIRLLVNAVS